MEKFGFVQKTLFPPRNGICTLFLQAEPYIVTKSQTDTHFLDALFSKIHKNCVN